MAQQPVSADPKSSRHLATGFLQQLTQLQSRWAEAIGDEHVARAWLHEYSDRLDSFLRALWTELLPDLEAGLFAVGGYGRREMFPESDIDILILVADAAEIERVQAVLYVLWDTGLTIGHSVRTLDDCLREGKDDVTVYTNLLDARLIAGRTELDEQLTELVRGDAITNDWQFFQDKSNEQAARYRAQDESGARIEPNIKEGPGGLRDLQTLRWVAKRVHGAETFAEMHRIGLLRDSEFHALAAAENLLFRVRIGLHGLAERGEERLLLMHQKTLASHFGYPQDEGNRGVEQFMQSYFRSVIEAERLNHLLLQDFRERLDPRTAAEPEPLNPRFQIRGNLLETRDAQVFMRSPTAMLELFLILAQNPQVHGMTASTARQLRANLPVIDEGFRRNPTAQRLFLELLRADHGVYLALRHMNLTGVLAAYIPEFAPIVGLMQFDLFHLYTVDAHTLLVIRQLRRFADKKHAGENPIAEDTAKRIPKPELLYIAGLFHDIAKGRGGDHAILGAQDVRRFAELHKLDHESVDLLVWLVEQHLLMSFTAQRRDIEDPAIVTEFAEAVGTPERLDYLYLLTVADIRATNPTLWNTWRDSLLKRLLQLTRAHFAEGTRSATTIVDETRRHAVEEGKASGMDDSKLGAWLDNMPPEYFLRNETADILQHSRLAIGTKLPSVAIDTHLQSQATRVLILARNRPGLFAQIVAEIDREGLSVQSANMTVAHPQHQEASTISETEKEASLLLLEVFVLNQEGRPVSDGWLLESLESRLKQSLENPDQPRPRIRRRMPPQMSSIQVETTVDIQQDPQRHRSIIQIITKDRPGLLADLADVLRSEGVILLHARISTLGERVEDAFYIVDKDEQPITDPAHQERIRVALMESADGSS